MVKSLQGTVYNQNDNDYITKLLYSDDIYRPNHFKGYITVTQMIMIISKKL